MIIGKILNNNVVISTNDAGQEVIYMGRGIAFKKKSAIQWMKPLSKKNLC